MSTTLELKIRLRALEARVRVLEERQVHPEAVKLEPIVEKSERKMCPHCGVKPNHFFHVKNCPEKNKNNGANEEANR